MPNDVRDNTQRHRFELNADGHIAVSEYKRAGGAITIMHTEVPKELSGKGIGSQLVRGLLEIARARPKGSTEVPLHRRLYRQASRIRGSGKVAQTSAANRTQAGVIIFVWRMILSENRFPLMH